MTLYKHLVETKRVFKFLSGLNKDLDEVRGRVLSLKPLPSIREVFSTVRHEESRRKVMMRENSSLVPTHIESSALVSLDNSPMLHETRLIRNLAKADHTVTTAADQDTRVRPVGSSIQN